MLVWCTVSFKSEIESWSLDFSKQTVHWNNIYMELMSTFLTDFMKQSKFFIVICLMD